MRKMALPQSNTFKMNNTYYLYDSFNFTVPMVQILLPVPIDTKLYYIAEGRCKTPPFPSFSNATHYLFQFPYHARDG